MITSWYFAPTITIKMRFAAASIVMGIALVATCLGGPIDIGTGLDLTPGDITFWNKDLVIGDQPIQVGLGWKLDGTIAAGAKVLAQVGGKQVPISAALNTNIDDLKAQNWEQIMYEVGTNVKDTVAGVVMGDLNGNIQYQVNAKVPVKATGVSSIGASLLGTGLQQNSLSGVVAVGKEVIQTEVAFTGLKPSLFNVQIGANPHSK